MKRFEEIEAEHTEMNKEMTELGFSDDLLGHLGKLANDIAEGVVSIVSMAEFNQIKEERDSYKCALEEIIQLDGKFGCESTDIARTALGKV